MSRDSHLHLTVEMVIGGGSNVPSPNDIRPCPQSETSQVMGITQVGSGETEGFEEGADLEFHDAAEGPNGLESEENSREAVLSHGDCGSSSPRECIELLNDPQHKSPATCHSGPKMENGPGPPQNQLYFVRGSSTWGILSNLNFLSSVLINLLDKSVY